MFFSENIVSVTFTLILLSILKYSDIAVSYRNPKFLESLILLIIYYIVQSESCHINKGTKIFKYCACPAERVSL